MKQAADRHPAALEKLRTIMEAPGMREAALKEASKLPGGTNVVVYSDSRNAVVGALTGNGPQSATTVQVPKDQTSATFDIATNDTGIAPSGSSTANITAFYAQPTRAQLTVKASR
jgi:hypothetical protein